MKTQSSRINNKRKFKINKVERKRHVGNLDVDNKTEANQPNVKNLNTPHTGSSDNNITQISNNTETSSITTKPNTNPTKQPLNKTNIKNQDPISSPLPPSLGITNSTKFKKSGKYFKMSKLNREKVHKNSDPSSTLINELSLNEVKFQDLNRYLNQK